MPILIAQGTESRDRWRRPLRAGESLVIGRAADCWSVPWDQRVSRRHAELCFEQGRLHVKRLASGLNPIFLSGKETDEFDISPGEHFVIGDTSFILAVEAAEGSDPPDRPVEEQTFSAQDLRRVQFRNPDQRLDVLARLPEVISGSVNDAELFIRLVNMLLAGIPRANTAAVVEFDALAESPQPVEVLHWDRRQMTEGGFHPSQRLVAKAVRGEQSVLHVWDAKPEPGDPSFTLSENADWAFCTPVPGHACPGWALYVAGHLTHEPTSAPHSSGAAPDRADSLREDLRFTELVASTISALRQVQLLERQQTTLGQFFAPAVLKAITHQQADVVLAPRETEVSVLFCDLRGFSMRSERSADNLLGLLERVSEALGVMTHHILEQGGVFGDFQGDAAMGFWGWPLGQDDKVARACLAALAIRREFEIAARQPDHPLSDFRMGIGLATGTAVAGRIGTADQSKVTVFGPLVNRASRLEGMTKILHTPILLDQATALQVRQQVPRSAARCRRIAIVKPYGMTQPIEISELLPPADEFPDLSDENLHDYDQALEEFLAGHWTEALELLHRVPARDRVKDFLTVYIVEHNRTPPADFNGVIHLSSKS